MEEFFKQEIDRLIKENKIQKLDNAREMKCLKMNYEGIFDKAEEKQRFLI
jgi:hypothetical protein